ncbi:Phosphoglucomutase, chloroplastic [Porphyridium purpureum]|uniref:phosphoglucomutase (alpha-D-glucose-1,6-bisphosphate-dependent) n=1 Tax=Porphyridium purpureum TaxID=35688 RepID=A0A5J4YQL6_PORPP|nr:Phosphoglucomutase, chloroplastic [Porphyridium purpureum]|eukprot:POR7382..scf236_6
MAAFVGSASGGRRVAHPSPRVSAVPRAVTEVGASARRLTQWRAAAAGQTSTDTQHQYRKATAPIAGQKTGTSGLRKTVQEVQRTPNFVENWIQALFNVLSESRDAASAAACVLCLGGDGRYFNREACDVIIRMAAANGVNKIIVGRDGIMSTPAMSALIRARKAAGGIILTASHNPGGPEHGDWGIKYNIQSGGPATEALTDKIFAETLSITEFYLNDRMEPTDLSCVGTKHCDDGFCVEVVDPVHEYAKLLETVFDMNRLAAFVQRPDFSFVYDGMNAVSGEYAYRVFVGRLGAPADSLRNCKCLEDFGGIHPDPNLTYAADLARILGALPSGSEDRCSEKRPDFGAASDGDGDRNMILGANLFVSPSDSVAVIAEYAEAVIPYFQVNSITGVARSMPTSRALDQVAARRGWSCYETPTGWKYFGNLMDAGRIAICGEESFGTGSTHVREKDGLWAVLAWLSILEYRSRSAPSGSAPVSMSQIMQEHWHKYGRHYYGRHDYEKVQSDAADQLMAWLRSFVGSEVSAASQEGACNFTVDEFSYVDPVDGSSASQQGVRLLFTDGARVVFRLSGTGSSGATVRVYLERYEPPRAPNESASAADSRLARDVTVALDPLVQFVAQWTSIHARLCRTSPDVIT